MMCLIVDIQSPGLSSWYLPPAVKIPGKEGWCCSISRARLPMLRWDKKGDFQDCAMLASPGALASLVGDGMEEISRAGWMLTSLLGAQERECYAILWNGAACLLSPCVSLGWNVRWRSPSLDGGATPPQQEPVHLSYNPDPNIWLGSSLESHWLEIMPIQGLKQLPMVTAIAKWRQLARGQRCQEAWCFRCPMTDNLCED